MFGALDKIRMQLSFDLWSLDQLLAGFAQSSQTQQILGAFQSLIELQGNLEGPSSELSDILEWLDDSSARHLDLSGPAADFEVPVYSDLLREAVEGSDGSRN